MGLFSKAPGEIAGFSFGQDQIVAIAGRKSILPSETGSPLPDMRWNTPGRTDSDRDRAANLRPW